MITNIYDIDCIELSGKALPLKNFKGRPLLIVNTASLCGYSDQFSGLEKMHQQYQKDGLVVLGVPSNDFGRQEPGNSSEIAALCVNKFGVTFTFLQKMKITGHEIHPLFQWINSHGTFMSKTRWNFYKYLIDRQGQFKNWFGPTTDPASARFQKAILDIMQPN